MTSPFEFNPGQLERHLILQDDPIEALEFILVWLERSMSESAEAIGEVDERKIEAFGYTTYRLEKLRHERYFREDYASRGPDDERNYKKVIHGKEREMDLLLDFLADAVQGNPNKEDDDFDIKAEIAKIDKVCAEISGSVPSAGPSS
jgi:hypothetical protein